VLSVNTRSRNSLPLLHLVQSTYLIPRLSGAAEAGETVSVSLVTTPETTEVKKEMTVAVAARPRAEGQSNANSGVLGATTNNASSAWANVLIARSAVSFQNSDVNMLYLLLPV
jgi:hypothetical protein